MSSIAFHTPTNTLRVSSRERALMGSRIAELFAMVVGLHDRFQSGEHALKPYVKGFYGESYTGKEWISAFATSAHVGNDKMSIEIDGKRLDIWALQLNTAFAFGNDVVKLIARLHAQCEIHAWADGPNRAWLASVIQDGLRLGLFSSDPYGYDGWQKVAAMLESNDEQPVVTSYSVCESFPNAGVADWIAPKDADGEKDYDKWYDLPVKKQWELAMAGLRKSGGGLELRPNWGDFYFGDHDINAFQLMQQIYAKKS